MATSVPPQCTRVLLGEPRCGLVRGELYCLLQPYAHTGSDFPLTLIMSCALAPALVTVLSLLFICGLTKGKELPLAMRLVTHAASWILGKEINLIALKDQEP